MTEVNTVTPVRAQDRVSDVLARDESLVEVFVRCAPHFSKLRNRAMRRVMARLVTVEQAARTAQVPVERLVHDLNEALGLPDESVPASAAPSGESGNVDPNQSGVDAGAAVHPPSAPVVELDVRDDLRSGREPFSKIQATVARLAADEVLHLRAIFEPVPLYTVLGKRGFVHETQQHAPDDWSVWFWRPATMPNDPVASAPAVEAPVPAPEAEDIIWLDVRGLNPPEPLLRTLAALETLPPGHVLVQINSRVPQFLFPMLVERGFACEVDESQPDRVHVRIWAVQQDR